MKLIVVCYALLVFCLVDSSSGAGRQNFDRVTEALDRLLDYMKLYAHQMNVDALFGLILGEAETNAAWKYLRKKNLLADDDSEAMKTMASLKWKFSTVRQAIRKTLNHSRMTRVNRALLESVVLEPYVWESDAESSLSKQLAPVSSLRYSLGNFAERVQSSGIPNETQSDKCITAILDSAIAGQRQSDGDGFIDCFVSNECHYINVAEPLKASTAYSLTHRLLPLQIMRRLKCRGSSSANFTHLVSKYCNQIYSEFLSIAELNFPQFLQDLFLEQMALCGIEGYGQYFDDRFLEPVLSWQFPQGCYTVDMNLPTVKKKRSLVERKLRFKRVSEVTEYGCENHTTGLAAAVLAIWLKKIILQTNRGSSDECRL